jgi:cell division protein FtsA
MKAKLSNYIALDLGSNKIASLAAFVDKKGEIRILSQNLHYSEGFKSSLIVDFAAAESSIVNAVYTLEKGCDKNIKEVGISLSGAGTKSFYVSHKLKLSGNPITQNDIKKLIQKAVSDFRVKDYEIIHCFPIEFTVEDGNTVINPIGMISKELSCQVHIVAASSNLMANLTNCLAKCQISISDVSLAVYASGLACLSEDEKSLGAIIIDLGSQTTSFGVFLSGKLAYTGYIPVGSFHITSDIAKVFSLSFAAAEKLKVLYGNCYVLPHDKDNPINLDEIDPDNNYNMSMTINSSKLNSIIHARVEEILLMVKEQYDKAIVDNLIARRLIITGGGAMLRGITELAGKLFEKQVRIGRPTILPGFAEDYNPGAYSTVIGMVKNYSLKQQKSSGEVSQEDQSSSFVSKVITWLKENI